MLLEPVPDLKLRRPGQVDPALHGEHELQVTGSGGHACRSPDRAHQPVAEYPHLPKKAKHPGAAESEEHEDIPPGAERVSVQLLHPGLQAHAGYLRNQGGREYEACAGV